MKSRLIKPAPFDQIELPSLEICLTQENLRQEVDRHITHELLSRRTYQPVPTVEAGDIVTGFLGQKRLIITAGAGLFDTALEAALLNGHSGETVQTPAFSFRIERIERRVIPAFTDSFVQSLNLGPITTTAGYRTHLESYYRSFYFDNYLLYFAMEFFRSWMHSSEWYWDRDEMDALFREYRAMEQRYLDAHDIVIDGCEDDQLEDARDEVKAAAGMYLYLRYTDPESAPDDLHFEVQESLEQLRSLALRPVMDFLRDKVTFTDKEEDV